MVLAHHVIFTAYGFWLPNDPRGSWSEIVRQWDVFLHGRATTTDTRRSVAGKSHDKARRLAARSALRYTPVEFTGIQARAIGQAFGRAIAESGYAVHACSILPKHVHMVLGRHAHRAERMIGHLKARATQDLVAAGLHPFVRHRRVDGRFPSVWAHRAWKVFLNNADEIERAIRYVEMNPVKDGKKPQHWPFVTPWPGI
jgi:REP element-mobilizing transposase RayT